MGMKDFAGNILRGDEWAISLNSSIGIVKSDKTMKKFAESTVKYLRKHKFDGLDLGQSALSFPVLVEIIHLFLFRFRISRCRLAWQSQRRQAEVHKDVWSKRTWVLIESTMNERVRLGVVCHLRKRSGNQWQRAFASDGGCGSGESEHR